MLNQKDAEVDWIDIHLPNHTEDDYSDILNLPEHTVPESISYEVEAAADIDPDIDQPDDEGRNGQQAQAWIDFVNGHAVVGLNPQFYADTPPDELTEQAEDILLQWATHYRQSAEIEEEPET